MLRNLPSGLSLILGGVLTVFVVGCSSAALKQRQEQRDRVVQSAKMYCEFVNGDNNPDIDVAVNIAMGAKCESNKPFTMTTYRTPSEINGILFCCGTKEPKVEPKAEAPKKAEPKFEMKSELKSEPKAESVVEPKPVTKTAEPEVKPAAAVSVEAKAETRTEIKSETKSEAKIEQRKPNTSIQFEPAPDLDE